MISQLESNVIFPSVSAIVLLAIILGAIYALAKIPRTQTKSITLITILIWNLILFAMAIYVIIFLLPVDWTAKQALQTANDFFSLLNRRDYQAAESLVTYSPGDADFGKIQSSLENPDNRPVSWNLKVTARRAPDYSITGTVILPDNKEVPVIILVEWEWQTASWKIGMVEYEQLDSSSHNKNYINFASYSTDREFIIEAMFVLVSVLSIYTSAKYLLNLFKTKIAN